jgi:hypothetical protein
MIRTDGGSAITSETVNAYEWWDDAQQKTMRYRPDIGRSDVSTSTFFYDVSGRLQPVQIQGRDS